ncbi:hypothetical protein [Kribbia dieselivorans]|uniref:hypothetical protein n=1 Tax=Kribbia dieselivorans TaxID=331526 RepID=UPI0008397693|nr:hypothetical protein [Kribbia dieselivorans]
MTVLSMRVIPTAPDCATVAPRTVSYVEAAQEVAARFVPVPATTAARANAVTHAAVALLRHPRDPARWSALADALQAAERPAEAAHAARRSRWLDDLIRRAQHALELAHPTLPDTATPPGRHPEAKPPDPLVSARQLLTAPCAPPAHRGPLAQR